MNRINAHYLAGLFDGEGSVMLLKKRPIKKPEIQIVNTDKILMKKLYYCFNFGKLYNIGMRGKSKKDIWRISFHTPKTVVKICNLIINKVHIKKKKKLLKIARKYASWLLKNQKKHKTWAGKSTKWYKDFAFVKVNFIIPFENINKEI